jgi:hypothetical protein
MVVVEAAIVGAAGYGLYRGGDAAVRKGKAAVKEYERESKRASQRSELQNKTRARSDRIAKIASLRSSRENGGGASVGAGTTGTTSTPPVAQTVEERHREVMNSLRRGRQEEAAKSRNGSNRNVGVGIGLSSSSSKTNGRIFSNPFRRK